MKIFFWGNTRGLYGPDHAGRMLRDHLTECFLYTKSENKYVEWLEGIWKLLWCKVLVVSGVSRKGCVFTGTSRLLKKKTIYIMHGCSEYENVLNGSTPSVKGLRQERYLLEKADLLLPVSEKFMEWVKQRYPQYADKTKFLYNGIETICVPEKAGIAPVAGSIMAAGGTARLKGNGPLAKAVAAIPDACLKIYGNAAETAEKVNAENVQYMGTVSHDVFLRQLTQTQLFVVNSLFETFSLAAVEALSCGCSVLLSEVAGVTGILQLEEQDIIHDPSDQEEIKRKIEYLLAHPNNGRILSALNIEDHSYARTVKRLEEICKELC